MATYIPSVGVLTIEVALKGPMPAEVCAATRTEYSALGMRAVNMACLLVVMMVVVDIPGVLRRTVYLVITPFQEDVGGGVQVTESEVAEERLTLTLLGAPLGAGKEEKVYYYIYIAWLTFKEEL